MQRFSISLLLSVLNLSNLGATKSVVSNELIGRIITQVRQEMTDYKADNTVASQLMLLNTEITTMKIELQKTNDELKKTKSEVELLRSRESNPGSSSFVRWGRKSCPGNTTLVYYGVAGGKRHNEKGSGTNRLCLSKQPEFDNNIKPSIWMGRLYGAEYEGIQGHHDHDVPCSVCLAPESTTIMVPGTRTCPPTWTRQYHGHLISQYYDHFATEYDCLDQEPENDSSGVLNQNGNLYYYTVTRCGSLPCPPYVNDKVVTCVVCSK